MDSPLFPEISHKPLGEVIAHWEDYVDACRTFGKDPGYYAEDTLFWLKQLHHGEEERGTIGGEKKGKSAKDLLIDILGDKDIQDEDIIKVFYEDTKDVTEQIQTRLSSGELFAMAVIKKKKKE